MANENFIDYVKIFLRSGKGGGGSAHLRRDKLTAKGGPDGGDGGRGGHIILRANAQMWTLLHLRYKRHFFAEDGGHGSQSTSTGADGKDIIIEVPLGTVVKDASNFEEIIELTEDGQEYIVAHGGRGGLGNVNFKSATLQTPRFAQPGEDGIEMAIILELKVLADVGLVGFPSVGKSTLLSVVSAAKPKIAEYHFTTLVPNLGIVKYRDEQSFVMADIPGIIEGASEGRGLGHRFLRHIERNSILLYMLSAEELNIRKEYDILHDELKKYNPELLDKGKIVVITKSDLIDEELEQELVEQLPEGMPYVFISSITGKGIMQLKDIIWQKINE